jgi:hypothetical protein
MMLRFQTAIIAIATALSATTSLHAALSINWARELASYGDDSSLDVVTDASGNIYITGVKSTLLGRPGPGTSEAFLSKYDSSGSLAWTRQIDSSGYDVSYSAATDKLGNVYIAGATSGSLGGINAGSWDAFLAKYDPSGSLAWIRQRGTSEFDQFNAVATDEFGNVYTAGGAFLSKYDPFGTLNWTRQLGSGGSTGVATDRAGNVYITGDVTDDPGGPGLSDVFLSKYDATGLFAWTQQIGGAGTDLSRDIAIDATGNVYIAGGTHGNLDGINAGQLDPFLIKYASTGDLSWVRQFGTSFYEEAMAVTIDQLGDVYVAGGTSGDLGGVNSGYYDAFVSKFDATGSITWTQLFGDADYEYANGVAVDAYGNIYVTGEAEDKLVPSFYRIDDVFLVSFREAPAVPELSTSILALLAAASTLAMGIRRAAR